MATLVKAFTATGAGPAMSVKAGDVATWSVANVFVGTWVLQKSFSGGMAWETVATGTSTSSGTYRNNEGKGDVLLRFLCSAYTSGTVTSSISESAVTVQVFTTPNGDTILTLTETGVSVPGTLTVTGATTLSGSTTLSAAVTATSTVDVTGDVTMGASLQVTGPASAASFTGDIVHGSDPVTAAGSNQGDAAAITADSNAVVQVTGADGTVGVVLPTPGGFKSFFVKNLDNAVLKVYPASGGTINTLAQDAAIDMAARTCCQFISVSATQWYTSPLVPS